MILMQGKGVSKGVVKGPIYFYQRGAVTISTAKAADIEKEKQRLEEAKEKSMEQLTALAEKAREEAGDESAMLFKAHAMFVEDEDFVDCMNAALDEEQCTAERAVEIAGEQFAAMLAAMDDAYMQARAADIKDVARRILNNLMGVVEGGIDSEEPVILAADDLAPPRPSSWTRARSWASSPRAARATATPPSWPAPWASPRSVVWGIR